MGPVNVFSFIQLSNFRGPHCFQDFDVIIVDKVVDSIHVGELLLVF